MKFTVSLNISIKIIIKRISSRKQSFYAILCLSRVKGMSIKMKNSRKVLVFIIIYCFLCKTTLFAQDLEDTEKIVYQPVSKIK